MEFDSDYEFNAPKYIDFLSNKSENEYTDAWFDEHPDGHEGGIRMSQVPSLSHHSNFQAATRAISAALSGSDEHEHQHGNVAGDQSETGGGAECDFDGGSAVTDQNEASSEKLEGSRPQAKSGGKRTPVSALRKRAHSPRQTHSVNSKDSKETENKAGNAKKPRVFVRKPALTVPNTPSFLRRLRGRSRDKKTSDTLEIEKINALQDETKKMLKKNKSSILKALAPQTALLPKRAVDVTTPMEFKFATDARIKQQPMKAKADRPASGDFIGQLRKHPPSPTLKGKKFTKPEPFKFSSSATTSKTITSEWKSVASAVSDFQNKTPERWRSRPVNQQNFVDNVCSKTKLEVTHPKTPQLTTRNRSRPKTAPSQAELEGKIVEEMASYKFKAREFDHKLVELNGMCGVDPMKHLPVTETKPFSFQSDVRLEHRKKHEEEKKEKGEIAKKEHHHEKASEKKNASIDSNYAGKKKTKLTEPEPFSFESRDKEMIQKKQEKILKVYEEEEKAREFHARPLPNLSPDLVPVKTGKHTDIAPFKLATDERGTIKEEKWQSQLMQERENVKEMSKFKAKPCKVIHQDGFKVKPTPKPLTEVSEFKLNTEERSRKRGSYEIMKKEMQRVKEDEIQQSLKEKENEDAKEIALLRKQTVHKANPVRHFDDFEIRPSDRPLTIPETPKFETSRRFRKKSGNSQKFLSAK